MTESGPSDGKEPISRKNLCYVTRRCRALIGEGSPVTEIPGYDYGTARAARSPLKLEELRELEAAIGWTRRDDEALKMAGEVLRDQAEALVDHWRGQIAKQPHLAKWFFGPDSKPDEDYKAAVKKRFVQWVVDACAKPRDQAWLDYQEEIGLRHTPAKKNKADRAPTPDRVPLRFLFAFLAPTILDAKPLLAKKGHTPPDVEAMHQAWTKNAVLHLTLWSRPYAKEGLW
jgi:Protoglobin